KVNFGTILLTQADGTDKMLMALGFGMAFLNGLGLPSFTFLYGNIINAFADEKNMLDSVRDLALILIYIGLAIWASSYIYFTCSMILAERLGKKTRVAYLRAILNQ